MAENTREDVGAGGRAAGAAEGCAGEPAGMGAQAAGAQGAGAQAPAVDERPVAERLGELLADMGAQKDFLLAILDFCREERTSAEVDEMLAPLQEFRRSIYTPVTMRALLEQAGALTYLANDDAPEEQVDENGDLVLPEPSVCTWLATDEALAYCETLDPFADLVHALDAEEAYGDLYALVLRMCAEQPRSISQIAAAVEQTGRLDGVEGLDPGHFVGRLEDAGALEWRGSWVVSELGARYLELVGAADGEPADRAGEQAGDGVDGE